MTQINVYVMVEGRFPRTYSLRLRSPSMSQVIAERTSIYRFSPEIWQHLFIFSTLHQTLLWPTNIPAWITEFTRTNLTSLYVYVFFSFLAQGKALCRFSYYQSNSTTALPKLKTWPRWFIPRIPYGWEWNQTEVWLINQRPLPSFFSSVSGPTRQLATKRHAGELGTTASPACLHWHFSKLFAATSAVHTLINISIPAREIYTSLNLTVDQSEALPSKCSNLIFHCVLPS